MGAMKKLYTERIMGRETAQERHEKKWAKYKPAKPKAPKPKPGAPK